MNVRLKYISYGYTRERCLFRLVIFLCVPFHQNSVQGGLFSRPEALYGPGDHVVVLNSTNIKSTIYGTTNAWVVEFFSSWCGHCINFAPVYKQFAAEVEGWKTVAKVAGIDCADENNVPTCREYEVMGYPTILFFPPNSPLTTLKKTEDKPDLYRGEQFQRSERVTQLKSELMELLTPHFPNVLGDVTTSLGSFVGVWKHVKSSVSSVTPSLVVLLFEKDKSLMGKELALLLSSYPEIRVLRFQQRNQLYARLGLKTEWPAAGYITPDLRGGKFIIPKNKDIVKFLQASALQMINSKAGINPPPSLKPDEGAPAPQIALALSEAGGVGGKQIGGEEDEANKQENNLEEPALMQVSSANEDVVSLEDLIHAVRNSLRNEVGVLNVISGSKLSALKQYVHVLAQLFPADRREMIVFLMKLNKYLEGQTSEQLQVNDYLDKLTELELELHPWDIDINSWGSCRGTKPGRRGYTCSLWRLFHTLTILATQKSREIFVLPVIHGYVKEFFGCTECVEHFTKMVADEGPLMLSTVKEQAVWLWKAHNKVNIRLKGSASEDPGFPKGFYPNEKQCPSCHKEGEEEGVFDDDKVFGYLVNVYTHPTRTMQQAVQKRDAEGIVHFPNHQSKQHHHSSSSRFFSGTDYWIFCIVYLSVAALLIFGYYHFKLGSSRRSRLDPFAICRKIVNTSRSMV